LTEAAEQQPESVHPRGYHFWWIAILTAFSNRELHTGLLMENNRLYSSSVSRNNNYFSQSTMNEPDLIIEPRRGKKEKSLPAQALLVVNPAEADYALGKFKPFTGESRSLYQTTLLVDREQSLCLAGPALGAAAAVLVLEKLIVLGVKEIWLLSCCGSLDPAWSIGDIVLATGAVSGEGVSPHYSTNILATPEASASRLLENFVSQYRSDLRRGIIWSTDAPYRERRSELLKLQERYGVAGIDMEFSALSTVASYRGVRIGALFVVSDMLWTSNWKPGFSAAEFTESSHRLIDRLLAHGLKKEPLQ
jgi:uridine phosphorylase